MCLTEEQKERIRKNRERALEIQKRRRAEERKGKAASAEMGSDDCGGDAEPPRKIIKHLDKQEKDGATGQEGEDTEEAFELEDFEVGASNYVTKKEAMKMYLLPEGTLAICDFVEKRNPHNKGWQPMKLYNRAQVRRLSRERFGGLQGVVEERRKREEKRFQKDLDETKDLFSSSRK